VGGGGGGWRTSRHTDALVYDLQSEHGRHRAQSKTVERQCVNQWFSPSACRSRSGTNAVVSIRDRKDPPLKGASTVMMRMGPTLDICNDPLRLWKSPYQTLNVPCRQPLRRLRCNFRRGSEQTMMYEQFSYCARARIKDGTEISNEGHCWKLASNTATSKRRQDRRLPFAPPLTPCR